MSSESTTAEALATEASHTTHYDPAGSKIGMWLFLFTEVILFGTLFIAYAVYSSQYHAEFAAGAAHLNRPIGSLNTAILLTSSLTMALSIAATGLGKRKAALRLMGATMAMGLAFLVIKSFEWSAKFDAGIYPRSEFVDASPRGEQIFYGLYFTMTGLHALHVIVGMVAIGAAMVLVARGRVHKSRIALLENVGLYWHLVDLVWIFLFPLFYLLR